MRFTAGEQEKLSAMRSAGSASRHDLPDVCSLAATEKISGRIMPIVRCNT
jgi:hypothetical protein